MWIAEKFQSNPEIAGSPRNSFRASLMESLTQVEHWIVEGASKSTKRYQTPNGVKIYVGVRLRDINCIVKRETAQTYS